MGDRNEMGRVVPCCSVLAETKDTGLSFSTKQNVIVLDPFLCCLFTYLRTGLSAVTPVGKTPCRVAALVTCMVVS